MPLTTILLEYSSDPVSDTTPTWVTVSQAELLRVEWWMGTGSEGDDPEEGGATIELVNVNRKWEPLYGSNVIDTHQRFRLTLNGVQEGVWFITNITIDYPGNTEWSVVSFQCAGGFEVLALDHLLSLDPPEAESYEDVVNFYGPWGYWRLGEQAGTRAAAIVKRRFRGKGRHRRKIRVRQGTRYSTREEAGGVSGAAGVYKNLPALGQPGAIVGDTDTCVLFERSLLQHVSVPVDVSDMVDTNRITVMAWIKPTSATGASPYRGIVAGPTFTGAPVWAIDHGGSVADSLVFQITDTGSTVREAETAASSVPLDEWSFVAGTFDGAMLRCYINGVEEASTAAAVTMKQGSAGGSLLIGRDVFGAYFDGYIDEPAVIERALSEAELTNLYVSGAERGWPQQEADVRIGELATSGLWDEGGVVLGAGSNREVVPRMQHGQARLDEISETMHAEGPQTVFFFDGVGNPIYLGHEWRARSAVYRTVQATFGQSEFGEIPVDGLEPVYDHETYNVIQASCEGSGELVEVEDTVASGKRGRRVLDDYTGLLLAEHMETESLAAALLATYKDPVRKVAEISVSGWDDQRLDTILSLDIGDMVRVNWSGETGARNGQVANILRKHKSLDNTERPHVLRCTYRLSRGFDALEGSWRAGIVGWSEAGQTTTAA